MQEQNTGISNFNTEYTVRVWQDTFKLRKKKEFTI